MRQEYHAAISNQMVENGAQIPTRIDTSGRLDHIPLQKNHSHRFSLPKPRQDLLDCATQAFVRRLWNSLHYSLV